MRSFASALCVVGSLLLVAACDTGKDDDLEGNPIVVPEAFGPLFDPSNSVVPFPINLLFSGSTDGTLNIPVADATDLSDPQVALNALDGFSTIAPMSAGFSGAIDPATVTPATVRVFEATIDRATTAVVAVGTELTFGLDYIATVSSLDDSALAILPLRPLKANQGYVVVLTRGIRSTGDDASVPDTTYALARLPAPPDLPPAQAAALEPLRQLINAQDAALEVKEAGLASSAALAWSFTTQSIGLVLGNGNGVAGGARTETLGDAEVASAVNPVSIGTTATLAGSPFGFADVYVGTLTVPYYLTAASGPNDPAPLGTFWQGAGGSNLSLLNPTPVKTGNQTIPVLITVPNAASGQTRPNMGNDPWPVVIYQHGITTSRSTLLGIADSLAAAGFAAVAIDLPLHGLAPGHPLRAATDAMGAQERTFDLDLVTQDPGTGSILAPTPDTITDSSGRHLINLASLLTSRDNLRQAVSDLFALFSQIDEIDYDNDAGNNPDFDASPGNARFVGWSLGGMVGSVFLALEPDVGAAVLAMPGGGIAKILDASASFGDEIAAGLAAAAGLMRGDPDFEAFLGAAQTVVDSADPLNYASPALTTPGGNQGTTAGGARGVMMFEVIGDGAGNLPDQTIPNHVGTLAMGFMDAPPGIVPSPTAGTDPLHTAMGLNQVTGTVLNAGGDMSAETLPLLRFSAGYHGSIVDPAMSPAANADVTTLMQGAMATHLASNGAGFDADPNDLVVDVRTVVADN